ncbi:MAG TPA: glycosyl hydrolase, partial [Thermoanaerobaculia bacterium]|nr:glycosyl hydrolase [Thermoanaerobaculia bacterium]
MRPAFLVRALLLAPFGIFGEVSELASQVGPFWASVGPEGINAVLSLAVDPTTTSTLYAGTDGAGVFKST